ncbi:MAG: DUF6624 domain-containing protein [Hyphomonadaceae bacterium]
MQSAKRAAAFIGLVFVSACAQPVLSPETSAFPEAEQAVSDSAREAFERYSALAPRTAAPPSVDQAPHFVEIEQLLQGAREDESAWNRELFLRAAQDQFWRSGVNIATAEELGLGPEDVGGFHLLVWRQIEQIDKSNTDFLKAEVDRRDGWMPKSEVGGGAAHFAWLLIQHADRDAAFQERVVILMEPMVAIGEVDAQDFAYLFDRVASAADRPQRYGTQGRCIAGEDRWEVNTLEDPARIDDLRASVGLSTMAEYVAVFAANRVCEG